MFAMIATILAATPLNQPANPQPDEIPLSQAIIQLTHGLEWLALIGALVGLLISAGVWAAGAYSNNFQQTFNGKRGVAISLLAAVIVGIAPMLLNSLFTQGTQAQ